MSRIIAISNQKGGVGKTTTSVNLSASLAATQKSVLLIDLDPQGNATMGSGVDKNAQEHTTNELLLGEKTIDEIKIATIGGFDLAPANGNLTVAEVNLLQQEGREKRLRDALKNTGAYDYVLIDCPPTLNILTVNALVAAQSVIIPMQCEYYALEGLAALVTTIQQVQQHLNSSLEIEGILRTMYDARSRLSLDVSKQLRDVFGTRVYRTVIPRNVRLAEAPSHGLPALLFDKNSQGAKAYLVLAGEIIRNQQTLMSDSRTKELV